MTLTRISLLADEKRISEIDDWLASGLPGGRSALVELLNMIRARDEALRGAWGVLEKFARYFDVPQNIGGVLPVLTLYEASPLWEWVIEARALLAGVGEDV